MQSRRPRVLVTTGRKLNTLMKRTCRPIAKHCLCIKASQRLRHFDGLLRLNAELPAMRTTGASMNSWTCVTFSNEWSFHGIGVVWCAVSAAIRRRSIKATWSRDSEYPSVARGRKSIGLDLRVCAGPVTLLAFCIFFAKNGNSNS